MTVEVVHAVTGEVIDYHPANPVEAWRSMVANASTVNGLTALRDRAAGAGWLTEEVSAALDAREEAVRVTDAPDDYEAQASAEFDAAVERGEAHDG